jgi:heat shock protein HtpX
MMWVKRIALFLVVNFLVVAVISFICYFFNLQPFLTQHHLNYSSLALFCLIWGMMGSFISLALSKVMAKWMMGVEIIQPNTGNSTQAELLHMVHHLAKKAGLPAMPEVGIFQSNEVNAFATGPSKSNSLVAVSSGLLNRLGKDEVEAVIGHEITHIANGDMVTMTLLQGIVNAFVMFLARIIAFGVSRVMSRGRDDSEGSFSPLTFQLLVFFFEMIFMVLGSMVVARFSRYREFRADAGGARLAGTQKMIAALQALKISSERRGEQAGPQAFQSLKISNPGGFLKLFASHPPLEERIARLQKRNTAVS